MRVTHVNSGTKATYKVNGSLVQIIVPGLDPVTFNLTDEQKELDSVIDLSLNNGFTALERGVGTWYVASIKLPAKQYIIQETGETDPDGWPITEELIAPVAMDTVVLCLWGLPENLANMVEPEAN